MGIMGKTIKTNRQLEQEKTHGKIAYRKRMIEEQEAEEEISSVFVPRKHNGKKFCFTSCGEHCDCMESIVIANKKI